VIKIIIAATITLFISGCYSIKMVKLGTVIKDNKTIEVPATGFSIMDIKSALAQDGWKIKVTNENVQRNRLESSNPKIDTKNQYDAGY
jgi:G:T/U-mismatch repair DNA glycosylase